MMEKQKPSSGSFLVKCVFWDLFPSDPPPFFLLPSSFFLWPPSLPSFFLPPSPPSYFSVVSCSIYYPAQGVNPSQFSSLSAPIKKGLACVICQTIVSAFSPPPPALPSPHLPSKSFHSELHSPFSIYRNKTWNVFQSS